MWYDEIECNRNRNKDSKRVTYSTPKGQSKPFNSILYSYIKEWIKSPQVGFEPTTNQLTADRSTTELLRKNELLNKLNTHIISIWHSNTFHNNWDSKTGDQDSDPGYLSDVW